MIIRASARKHGISDHDCAVAARAPVVAGPLDEEMPQRELRLGFDSHGRLLEIIVLIWDDGTVEVIHAMKCRPKYLRLLDL